MVQPAPRKELGSPPHAAQHYGRDDPEGARDEGRREAQSRHAQGAHRGTGVGHWAPAIAALRGGPRERSRSNSGI